MASPEEEVPSWWMEPDPETKGRGGCRVGPEKSCLEEESTSWEGMGFQVEKAMFRNQGDELCPCGDKTQGTVQQ